MSDSIEVSPVLDDADREAFLRFPFDRYAGDPNWVAPPGPWIRRRLDPAHNSFLRDDNLRLFVARRAGRVVGTISALRDRQHEEMRGESVAFFGFFETIGDPSVAEALIARAEAVAREWGAALLRGPRNLTRVEEVGILVEGFHTRPPMLASHHPESYAPMLEALGFAKHHDVLAYEIPLVTADGAPVPFPPALVEKAKAVDVPGLVVRSAHPMALGGDFDRIHRVFTDAYRDVPENTPMPRGQFASLLALGLLLGNRHLLQVATVKGRPAGFALCFPDLYEAVYPARGSLGAAGAAAIARALPRVRTASFKLIGVMPEYRTSGLHALLIVRAGEGVLRGGYQRMEGSLIDERNSRMRHIVESAGMRIYRRYRIYERAVPFA